MVFVVMVVVVVAERLRREDWDGRASIKRSIMGRA